MNPYANSMNAQAALYHDHPLTAIAFAVVGALVAIALVSVIRWLFSRSAWPYHPGGASGFLIDELVRWAAMLVPYLVLAIVFRFYVYDLHPELNTPNVWMIFVVCALAFRVVLRRLPFVKAMARHIDAAKAQAKAAKQGGGA